MMKLPRGNYFEVWEKKVAFVRDVLSCLCFLRESFDTGVTLPLDG